MNWARVFLNWFRSATSNVVGFTLVCQVAFSVPMCVGMLHLDYLDNNLTGAQILRDVGACVIGGVAFALLSWYTVCAPMLKRFEKRRGR